MQQEQRGSSRAPSPATVEAAAPSPASSSSHFFSSTTTNPQQTKVASSGNCQRSLKGKEREVDSVQEVQQQRREQRTEKDARTISKSRRSRTERDGAGELVGLGIEQVVPNVSLPPLPSSSTPWNPRLDDDDDLDSDKIPTSVSLDGDGFSLLVDAFPSPPIFSIPSSSSSTPLVSPTFVLPITTSSPVLSRSTLPSVIEAKPTTQSGLLSPISPTPSDIGRKTLTRRTSFARPVSEEFDPSQPPGVPLPPLPSRLPSIPGWTPPSSPLPHPHPPSPNLLLPTLYESPLLPLSPPPSFPLPALPPTSTSPRLSLTSSTNTPSRRTSRSSLLSSSSPRQRSPSPPVEAEISFDNLVNRPLPKKRLSRRRSSLLLSPNSLAAPSSPSSSSTSSRSSWLQQQRRASSSSRISLSSTSLAEDEHEEAEVEVVEGGGDDDESTSEDSEIDVEASLETLAWRAGVMSKGLGLGLLSEELVDEGPGREKEGRKEVRRRKLEGYKPYKLTRRASYQLSASTTHVVAPSTTARTSFTNHPSLVDGNSSSGDTSDEEEQFDLSFDSRSTTTTVSSSSVSMATSSIFSRSRESTSDSFGTLDDGEEEVDESPPLTPKASGADGMRLSWGGVETETNGGSPTTQQARWRTSSFSAPAELEGCAEEEEEKEREETKKTSMSNLKPLQTVIKVTRQPSLLRKPSSNGSTPSPTDTTSTPLPPTSAAPPRRTLLPRASTSALRPLATASTSTVVSSSRLPRCSAHPSSTTPTTTLRTRPSLIGMRTTTPVGTASGGPKGHSRKVSSTLPYVHGATTTTTAAVGESGVLGGRRPSGIPSIASGGLGGKRPSGA